MNFPLARTVRKLKEAISRRLPQRRDHSGLTTLEWLLIVAAVAGLAALAVVLVQNVVVRHVRADSRLQRPQDRR